jgi:peptidyl-prolyl cis-trans isomerase C
MNNTTDLSPPTVARVNGQALHGIDEMLDQDNWRQRLFTELLRQQAQTEGLLAEEDRCEEDGVISQAAADAIEALIARHVRANEPDEEACRRYHAAQPLLFSSGEQLDLRHILFAVTEGVDVNALRQRAETLLVQLRATSDPTDGGFAEAARQWSNCPSAQEGGALGWLGTADCAPEFTKAVFGQQHIGVMPQLVPSRFGFHVVQVLQRKPGQAQPFEEVRQAVAQKLRQQSFATAMRQYLMGLAEAAVLQGVDLAELAPASEA